MKLCSFLTFLNNSSAKVLSLSHNRLYTQLILFPNTKVVSSLPFSASMGHTHSLLMFATQRHTLVGCLNVNEIWMDWELE